MTIGLDDEDERIKAGKTLSNKVIPGISDHQPIRVSVKWPIPKGACVRCYHPTNPDKYSMHFRKRGGGPACPNQGDFCLTCKSTNHKTRKCGYEMEATYAIARPADKKSVTPKKVKAEPTRLTAKSIKTNQKAAAASISQNKGWKTDWNATAAKAPTTRSRSSIGTSRTSTKGAAFSSDEDLPRKSHIKLNDTSPLTQASHEPRSSNTAPQWNLDTHLPRYSTVTCLEYSTNSSVNKILVQDTIVWNTLVFVTIMWIVHTTIFV